jgi:hypothetical protein
MWESNPPGPFVRSHTGFEVRRGHQTPCPPVGKMMVFPPAAGVKHAGPRGGADKTNAEINESPRDGVYNIE